MIDIELDVEMYLTLDASAFEEIKGYMVGDNESLADLEDLDKDFENALYTYVGFEASIGESANVLVPKKEVAKSLEAFMAYFGL